MNKIQHETLFSDAEALAALCRWHHIIRLSVFGSILKGTTRPESDLDHLVKFAPDQKPSLLRLAAIEAELSARSDRRVDLRTAEDLSRHFRAEVTSMAASHYAA
jgi:predicted nucleotidyltransferase